MRADWDAMTEPVDNAEAGDLIRFDNSNGTFGVGVLPNENTLITVRHHGRLIVAPLSAIGKTKLYRLR